ncbi:putative trans-sialidase, partial [Trypanosoma conorhini]
VTVNDPKDGASVFGVRFNGTDSAGNRLGLLCSGDKKWVVKSRTGETVAQAARCEPSKPYRVLLTLQEGSFSFFVNGTPLKPAGADAAALAKKDSEEIAHFYFGADDGMRDAGGSVTVTNAQLFNRAFTPEEEEYGDAYGDNEEEEGEDEEEDDKDDYDEEDEDDAEEGGDDDEEDLDAEDFASYTFEDSA